MMFLTKLKNIMINSEMGTERVTFFLNKYVLCKEQKLEKCRHASMLYLGNGGEPCVVLLVLDVVFQAPKDQHPHPHQQEQQAQILPAGLHRVCCASFATFRAQHLSFCNISDNNYNSIPMPTSRNSRPRSFQLVFTVWAAHHFPHLGQNT
jgi:hypothetical protein